MLSKNSLELSCEEILGAALYAHTYAQVSALGNSAQHR
jgi:hypothetical protein